MKKIFFTASIMSLALLACNDSKKENNEQPVQPTISASKDTASHMNMQVDENPALVKLSENRFDPICNMPVTAGVSDTLSYDGHVIGFCSPDCKAEFVKDPKAYTVEYRK